jgi:molybdopterin synthase catalytic subunit
VDNFPDYGKFFILSMVNKEKKYFIEGPLDPGMVADSIAKHSLKRDIGAHSIFLGQVRADNIRGKTVEAIEYSAYSEMAGKGFHKIRESAFAKFDLTCIHIYHSIGKVKAGEINMFVFVSSKHRKDAFDACCEIVEQVKKQVPIFGKEIFEDETYVWKENKQ